MTAPKSAPRPTRQSSYWVVAQHEDITVVSQATRPVSTVQQGERLKTVQGPFATNEEAEKRRTELEQKTLRWLVEQGR